MTHLTYNRGTYDKETKTVRLSTKDKPAIVGKKIWDVDPQRQIIDLLKEQLVLLKKIADSTVPYHTGSQAVSLLPVTPGGQKEPPVSLEESERGEF